MKLAYLTIVAAAALAMLLPIQMASAFGGSGHPGGGGGGHAGGFSHPGGVPHGPSFYRAPHSGQGFYRAPHSGQGFYKAPHSGQGFYKGPHAGTHLYRGPQHSVPEARWNHRDGHRDGRRGYWRHGHWYWWGAPVAGFGLYGGSCYWNCRSAGYSPEYCSYNADDFCY